MLQNGFSKTSSPFWFFPVSVQPSIGAKPRIPGGLFPVAFYFTSAASSRKYRCGRGRPRPRGSGPVAVLWPFGRERRADTSEQVVLVERLAQITDDPIAQRALSHAVVGVSRDKNGRYGLSRSH
jgi:hypothetical protein